MLLEPIGTIQTKYKTLDGMPIQPKGAQSAATIIIDERYEEGLKDLKGFSHIYLIYFLHRSEGYQLTVTPFLDNKEHGVFATRAPCRPNPIGLSIVKQLSISGNMIEVEGADLLSGTPILDIKPYIEQFDKPDQVKNGWVTATIDEVRDKKSDQRFIRD